jgi:hypothetical protein
MSNPIQDQWRIVRAGTDTYGRPVYMTWYHARWFQGRCKALGLDLRIAQGAFMTMVPGGGARASAHFHDRAKCVDISVRNLTASQRLRVVWHLRTEGAAAERRDPTPAHGGMGEHIHYNLGVDRTGSAGAEQQWAGYVSPGNNGLANGGRDYEQRPHPLVTVPSTPPFACLIHPGATGNHVKAIQRGLRIKVTGTYDPATVKALRAWKARHGWAPTAAIGARAYWAITPK